MARGHFVNGLPCLFRRLDAIELSLWHVDRRIRRSAIGYADAAVGSEQICAVQSAGVQLRLKGIKQGSI